MPRLTSAQCLVEHANQPDLFGYHEPCKATFAPPKTQVINLLDSTTEDVISAAEEPRIASEGEDSLRFPGLAIYDYPTDVLPTVIAIEKRHNVPQNGNIRLIDITSSKFSVEGGGHVGDSLDSIKVHYPEVEMRVGNTKAWYITMSPYEKDEFGFLFFLDSNDFVSDIVLGRWSSGK